MPTTQDYSYVSCSLVMYEDGSGGGGVSGGDGEGGGDGGGDNRDDADANDSMSAGGGSNGSEFDDDSSWTEDTASYAGTSSSGSSSSGKAKKEMGFVHGGDVSRGKWLKSLWTLVDRMDGERKSGRQPNSKHPTQPVKTILRPPITYKYVVGMSGLPSKVPVYPRRM